MAKKQLQSNSLAALSPAQKATMLKELAQKDSKLKTLMAKVEGGFTLAVKEAHSPFEAICEAIIYQQLTGKAAATILGRFNALFGSKSLPKPEQIVDAPEAVLRSAGLSGAKVAALKDLAAKTIVGQVPTLKKIEEMSDEEVIKCLTAVRGVGTWTAHMFLMFRLGRADVMPSGDYGVRKGFAITYGDGVTLPSPAEMEKYAERWSPYRSVGSWYMWRAIEVNRLHSVPEHKIVKKKTGVGKTSSKGSKTPTSTSIKKPAVKRKTTKSIGDNTASAGKKKSSNSASTTKKPTPKVIKTSTTKSIKKPETKKPVGRSNVVRKTVSKKRSS